MIRNLAKSKSSLIGLILTVIFFLVSITVLLTGNSLLPYPPNYIDASATLQGPTWAHPFGTDDLGRDLLARVLVAAPIDAEVGLTIVLTAAIIGICLGSFSGYFGGPVDELLMRITDVFLAFPAVILALVMAIAFGPGLLQMMEALTVVWWPAYARLTRGQILSVKQNSYVDAARVAGVRDLRIIIRHIIPNILAPILIYATADLGQVIISSSVLSYLGLGVQPPQAEWGRLVFDGQDYLPYAPWLSIVPALAIVLVALGFSILGDGLRDALDPKQRASS